VSRGVMRLVNGAQIRENWADEQGNKHLSGVSRQARLRREVG
jgi:hypothetical protein